MREVLIGIVGPCSAGKSTLIRGLNEKGYAAKHIAQEHSFVPDMWRRIVNPEILIFLDVSYPVSMRRRPLEMSELDFSEQVKRLTHAKDHADFYLHTDERTPIEVLNLVLEFLQRNQ